jgi:hypothetical protein
MNMFTKPILSTIGIIGALMPALVALTPDVWFFLSGLGLSVVVGAVQFWTASAALEDADTWGRWVLAGTKSVALAGIAGLLCGLWTYEMVAPNFPGLWYGMIGVAGWGGKTFIEFLAVLLTAILAKVHGFVDKKGGKDEN